MILPAEAGAYAVCVPLICDGQVQDILPSPVLAWVIDETGVTGIITPSRVFPAGSPVWGPDGIVESENGEWPDLQAYCKHLRETLIH